MNAKSTQLINEALTLIKATPNQAKYLKVVFEVIYVQGQIKGMTEMVDATKGVISAK